MKIMNVNQYLQYTDIDLTLRNATDNIDIEKIKEVPLPVTRDLAIALVAHDGNYLLLPGVKSFASDPLIAKLAYKTA